MSVDHAKALRLRVAQLRRVYDAVYRDAQNRCAAAADALRKAEDERRAFHRKLTAAHVAGLRKQERVR